MTAASEDLVELFDTRARRRESRRAFFTAAAAGAAGAAAFAFAGAAQAQAAPSDADILNFALNLEYLEANFYYFAVNGTAIPAASTDGSGTAGAATGGRQVQFDDPNIAGYAREIAADELAHVNFLRNALGSARVAQPRIDVSNTPFRAAAAAAGVANAASFDAYGDTNSFLLAAYLFEDVGVTAYKGAAPLITNNAFLDASAGILAAEAFHAGIVRGALYRRGVAVPDLLTVSRQISDARDVLDGTAVSAGPPQRVADADQGVERLATIYGEAANIAPTDANGVTFSRTTGQVLNIVYLSRASVTMGGFFPAGVNGTIRASAAN